MPRDVARAFADALGRPVEVQVIPREGFVDAYRKAGFSDAAAHAYARMTTLSIDDDFDKPASPIRGETDLDSFIAGALARPS